MEKTELEKIHKDYNDGRLEIINFVLKFLDEDKKECDETIIQEKKEGYINSKNEESWMDITIGRDSLHDRIEFELKELKHER